MNQPPENRTTSDDEVASDRSDPNATLIPRVPEPRSLDPAADAEMYADMDHQEVNQAFVDDLVAGQNVAGGQDIGEPNQESQPTGHQIPSHRIVGRQIIDLGCGPADIPIRLAERLSQQPELIGEAGDPTVSQTAHSQTDDAPQEFAGFRDGFQIMAIDCDVEMLEIAKREIDIAGFLDQIILQHADLDQLDAFDSSMADTVISNSVIHHLDDPVAGIRTAHRLARPKGRIFIRDLVRPASAEAVEDLVEKHGEPGNEPARQLLRQSLHASLTINEVQEALRGLGVDASSVQMTSDRHWTIDYIKP